MYNKLGDHTSIFAWDNPGLCLCSGIIINSTPFLSQEYLRLDNKLYGYPNNFRLTQFNLFPKLTLPWNPFNLEHVSTPWEMIFYTFPN